MTSTLYMELICCLIATAGAITAACIGRKR
jgi:hypothetical protein